MTTTAARRAARDNMIEGQLRACEVLDESVLAGYLALARDEFAPAAWGDLAFADAEIPLSDSAAMLAPKLEARMLQEMALCGGERILQIGVGGGLSRRAGRRFVRARARGCGRDRSRARGFRAR